MFRVAVVAAGTVAVLAAFVGVLYVRFSGDDRGSAPADVRNPSASPVFTTPSSGFVCVPVPGNKGCFPAEILYPPPFPCGGNYSNQSLESLDRPHSEQEAIWKAIDLASRLSSCNHPDRSTAWATRTTWAQAREMVLARGGFVEDMEDDGFRPSLPVWLVVMRGTFVQIYPYDLRPTPSRTPTAGTWLAIVGGPTAVGAVVLDTR